jgi:hypothetical protein
VSEYQYHEWQAVDRVLTLEEQDAVNDLSSYIEVSSSRAMITYHWSDFRHDPKQVLLKYFDAYFYLANWGSLRLMFRFPNGLLDEADIEPYCFDEYITFETNGRYQVLDLDFSPKDGGGWMEADAGLSHFIRLRAFIGVISLVKDRPQLILPQEIASLEAVLASHPEGLDYRVAVQKNQIVIYERRGLDIETLSAIFGKISVFQSDTVKMRLREQLDKMARFSPILRFILIDPEERKFTAERWSYMGDIDE